VSADHRRRITAYRIVWIHPDYNAQSCHYYEDTPGDLPNFDVELQNSEGPSETIDALVSADDLSVWLGDLESADA
jgi:hypothetical protein